MHQIEDLLDGQSYGQCHHDRNRISRRGFRGQDSVADCLSRQLGSRGTWTGYGITT